MERQLKELEGLSVDRCFKPANFGKIADCSLYHFADACKYGYGQASYLHIVDETGRIHCCLVIGNAKNGTGSCNTFCGNISPSEKGAADELRQGNLLDK